ncbi:MAG: transketolase [Candidatus Dependentiae bacterium]|nr:transketolase [Candidatus Dependentiae bacterium]
MNKQQIRNFLETKAYKLRVHSLEMTTNAGSGHPTSCLSAADLVSALFFYAMRYNPDNFNCPTNDRFILSKGHAAPLLYAAWAELGKVDQNDLLAYRTLHSPLEGHPTPRFPYTEAATGSLGNGLSIGAGMALYSQRFKVPFTTYVLMGDGEVSEGSVWEAAEIASFYKLHNLVALVDCNRLGQSSETIHGHHAQRYADKFAAFGWKTLVIDGHDMQQIMSALDKARDTSEYTHPTVIIAKTIKGYGVREVSDKNGFHGKPFKKEELPAILEGLKAFFPFGSGFNVSNIKWQQELPANPEAKEEKGCLGLQPHTVVYKKGELVATRKAYGRALTSLGLVCSKLVALDADVANSTYADMFAEKYPDRFVQCFIAEQNMVNMGIGFERRGSVPFISTFGAFFSRAADQVRMAAIGESSLRLVGSHAGVSIGQDGASQMALEDIAFMRTLPNSAVLYPSDAVSTTQLVSCMAEYTQGISYLRTTRMDTPVIYDMTENFVIGGCKVVMSSDTDQVCVIGAGVTLFEALKAHDQLALQGISIAVIDLYSIKPLDNKTVQEVALRSGKRVITVEDHYLEGGLGQAVVYALKDTDVTVSCLAVKRLPHSGSPSELLAFEQIDAKAIVTAVQQLLQKGE